MTDFYRITIAILVGVNAYLLLDRILLGMKVDACAEALVAMMEMIKQAVAESEKEAAKKPRKR